MATKARDTEAPAGKARSIDRASELHEILGELERVNHLNAVSFGAEDRLHTGSLSLDLFIGGGLAPGWYTFAGPEQSAKTTMAITVAAASVDQDVVMRTLWDAENSSGSSVKYIANIMRTMGVRNATPETVFGVRNRKGEYTIPPMVYYRDDYEGQKFFNWFYGLLTRLPDKRFSDGKWWLVWDDESDKMKTTAKVRALGYEIDPVMTKRNAGIWVQAENGSLQAVIVLDSLPSLLPPSMDDEEESRSMAQQARFYSKEIPRVKGMFRSKRVALVAINQLRLNPTAKFGNPETEPCGQAVGYYSDCRLRFFPNALGSAPFNPKPAPDGKGKFESEPSVEGEGVDTYRYISVSTIKNKLSTPGRDKVWLRLWVSDRKREGRGYDPVFDTFYYLHLTGQVTGTRKSMKLAIRGLGEATKAIDWQTFKVIISGSKEERSAAMEAIGLPPADIRRGCIGQIRKGLAQDLYLAKLEADEGRSSDELDGVTSPEQLAAPEDPDTGEELPVPGKRSRVSMNADDMTV